MKSRLAFLFIFAIVLMCGSASATTPTHLWNFNSSDATDSIGSLTLTKVGGAYDTGYAGIGFDSTNTGRLYATHPDDMNVSEFTINLFINPQEEPRDSTSILSQLGYADNTDKTFYVYNRGSSDELRFGVYNDTGGSFYASAAMPASYQIDNVSMITGRVNATHVALFYNGTLLDAVEYSGTIVYNDDSFMINTRKDVVSEWYMDAIYDEVSYYNSAITDSEILSWFGGEEESDEDFVVYPNESLYNAVAAATSGQTITLMTGIHNVTEQLNISSDNVQIVGSGSASVYAIDLENASYDDGVFSVDGYDNVSFLDFAINSYETSLTDAMESGIYLNNSNGSTINNISITNTNQGIRFDKNVDYSSILNTHVYDTRKGIIWSGNVVSNTHNTIGNCIIEDTTSWYGIDLNSNNDYNTISNTTVSGCAVGGVSIYSGSSRNEIHNNTFDDNQNCGIRLLGGNHNNVTHNNISNNSEAGVWFVCSYSNDGTILSYNIINDNNERGIYIYTNQVGYEDFLDISHNTIVNNPIAGIYNTNDRYNVSFVDNIIYNSTVAINSTYSSIITSDYNLLYDYTTAYSNVVQGANDILNEDPLFADVALFNYSLLVGSPAIDAASDGTDIGALQTVTEATQIELDTSKNYLNVPKKYTWDAGSWDISFVGTYYETQTVITGVEVMP